MQQISKIFKEIRVVVAISEEYVEDYEKNEEIFRSVLKVIGHEENISKIMSIVLTKKEDDVLL